MCGNDTFIKYFVFAARGGGGAYLVDDKVQIARRDHLPVEEVPLGPDAADGPARGLDGHHLLHHLLLVRVEEARELRRVERRVEFEEAAERRHRRLRAHVGDEQREVPLCGLRWRVFGVGRELFWVVVRRRVGGDELGARVEEKLFERR